MSRKYLIFMVLACAIPVAALATVFFFQAELSLPVLFALFLLCPLSHLLMFGGHGHNEHRAARNPHRKVDHG